MALAQTQTAGRVARELTDRSLVARFRELEIHLIHGPESPATLDEIGRIREREYRRVGAGRGGDRDLDRHDTEWPWYVQLVSWDPEERQIVALYRAIRCDWAIRHGGIDALRTAQLFSFSEEFVSRYLTSAVELGRSVVNSEARRALHGLFSVWVGLGALVNEWPGVEYFFGNVSLYRSLPDHALDAIIRYLALYHGAPRGLVTAREATNRWPSVSPGPANPDPVRASEAFGVLRDTASAEQWGLPPILLSYIKAHPGLLALDVARDPDFGGALEVAIAIPRAGLSPRTVDRFVSPYASINPGRFALPEDPRKAVP